MKLVYNAHDGKQIEMTADELIKTMQMRGLRNIDGTELEEVTESFRTSCTIDKNVRIVEDDGNEINVGLGDHILVTASRKLSSMDDKTFKDTYIRDLNRVLVPAGMEWIHG